MTLKDLKVAINNKNIIHDFLIFLCTDNYFLASTYAQAIAQNNNMTIQYIEALNEETTDTLSFLCPKDNLQVLYTDCFNDCYSNYTNFTDTIIICKKVDKKIIDLVSSYIIEFPKLVTWQLEDYAKTTCPNLEEECYSQLVKLFNEDPYKLNNELAKINIFESAKRMAIFTALKNDRLTDWFSFSIFELSNAILTKDFLTIGKCLYYVNNCDFEPMGLVTILLNNYKKILFVNHNSGVSLNTLGITQKQYNAIKYYYKDYSQDKLYRLIQFLTSIDLQLKQCKLELSKEYFLYYIISNILQIGGS